MCPASIFANNRTDKLIGRIQYDKTSIKVKIGSNHVGTPETIYNFKKWTLYLKNPRAVIPTKIKNAMKAVIKI